MTPTPNTFILIEDTISGHRRVAYVVRISERGTVWVRKATRSRRTGPTWTKDTTPTHYERIDGAAPRALVKGVVAEHGDPSASSANSVVKS